MAYGDLIPVEGYFFPTMIKDYGEDTKSLPMLIDSYEGVEGVDPDTEYKHPIIKALREGGKIEAVEVGDDWRDDHCTCFNIDITVAGKKYGAAFWWITQEFFKICMRCEAMKEKDLTTLREHIMDHDLGEEPDYPM